MMPNDRGSREGGPNAMKPSSMLKAAISGKQYEHVTGCESSSPRCRARPTNQKASEIEQFARKVCVFDVLWKVPVQIL
jgi:hypothetical protein